MRRACVAAVAAVLAVVLPLPAAADDAAPIEVSVHGAKRSSDGVGGDALVAQDVRAVPGTFGDPLQALAAMPGALPMASGLPYFYLRGAPPADTGYFVDGIPVPALFHIGPGPSYLPPGLLGRIELYPSTAPAQYGRYVGGIITAGLAPPRFDGPAGEGPRQTTGPAHGEASLRLFDASAFVEAPIAGDWDVAVGGRYGYPNLLLGLVAPDISLGYGDYTVRVAHRVTASDTLSVLALGGYDHEADAAGDLPPIDSQFHRIDLRYDHKWSSGSVRIATTFGYDRTAGVSSQTAGEIDVATTTRGRVELDQRIGTFARLSAGADASAVHYAFAPSTTGSTFNIGDEEMLGAWASLRFVLAPGVEITPGIRVDDTHRPSGLPGGSGVTVDPKLAARVALTPDLAWIWAMGIAHQEPSYVLPIPGVVVVAPSGFQEVDQLAGGFELRRLPLLERTSAKVTAFYSTEHQVSDFIVACGELLSCGPVGAANGRTYGLEVLLRRDLTERLGGWLSYTLSRAERYLGTVPYLSPFDRTHEISAVLRYDFGGGYSAGIRGTYYTGRPDFPSIQFGGGGGASALGAGAGPQISFGPGQIAQHRLPAFYRIDWRIDKTWRLGAGAELAVILEFFNTTLEKEAIEFQCTPTLGGGGGAPGAKGTLGGLCRASEVGPIALPSIGVEARW